MLLPWSPSPISESSFVRCRRFSSIAAAIARTISDVVSVALKPSPFRSLRMRQIDPPFLLLYPRPGYIQR
jgi:hypothetical protein